MDKEFLNKVVCQMVSETKINPTQSSITFPFPLSRFYRRMGNNVIDKLSFNPCSVNIYITPFYFQHLTQLSIQHFHLLFLIIVK
jgi:hypothetical protein